MTTGKQPYFCLRLAVCSIPNKSGRSVHRQRLKRMAGFSAPSGWAKLQFDRIGGEAGRKRGELRN